MLSLHLDNFVRVPFAPWMKSFSNWYLWNQRKCNPKHWSKSNSADKYKRRLGTTIEQNIMPTAANIEILDGENQSYFMVKALRPFPLSLSSLGRAINKKDAA